MKPISSNRVYDTLFNTEYIPNFYLCAELMDDNADFKYPDSDDSDIEEIESSSTIAMTEPNIIEPKKSHRSTAHQVGQGDEAESIESEESEPYDPYEDIIKALNSLLFKGHTKKKKLPSNKWSPFVESEEQCTCCLDPIYIDMTKGTLPPNESKELYIFYPIPKRGMSLKATFEIHTIGGRNLEFEVLIINNISAIKITPKEINLGKQFWYKCQKGQISLTNRDSNDYSIRLFEPSFNENEMKKLINGYYRLLTPKEFILTSRKTVSIDFTIRMGIYPKFKTSIGLDANSSSPLSVNIFGDNKIPWIFFENLPRMKRPKYHLLLMFQFFNQYYLHFLRYVEPEGLQEADEDTIESIRSYLDLYERSTRTSNRKSKVPEFIPYATNSNWLKYNLKIFKDAKSEVYYSAKVIEQCDPDVADFEVLDYPTNYPKVLSTHEIVETGFLAQNLLLSENVKMRFKLLLKNLPTEIKKFKSLLSHKYTILKPLPHMVFPYNCDFGNLILGETRKFCLKFFIQDHQRVLLSARTLINIPNFRVRFMEPEKDPDRFSIFYVELEPGKCGKYRNIRDRTPTDPDCMLCRRLYNVKQGQCNICELKLCHAHSYDFDLRLVHQREIDKSRKAIWDYYSRLIQGYKEHRDPFILTEIFEKDLRALGKVTKEEDFYLCIEFTPTEEYYDDGYIFDDLLLIDVSFDLLRSIIKFIFYRFTWVQLFLLP